VRLTDDVAYLLKAGVARGHLERMSAEEHAAAARRLRGEMSVVYSTPSKSGPCRSCGKPIALNARWCPGCGHFGVPNAKMARVLRWIWLALAIVLVLAILI